MSMSRSTEEGHCADPVMIRSLTRMIDPSRTVIVKSDVVDEDGGRLYSTTTQIVVLQPNVPRLLRKLYFYNPERVFIYLRMP